MTLTGSLTATSQDGTVHFRYEVTNGGDEDVTLQFSSAQTHDVVVLDGDEEVWSFASGRMFAQMLQSEEISAGESITYDAAWDDPAPGSYQAVARLAANGVDCEATTTFSI